MHEGTVDLELVDRQLLQIGQRRVAGAEVVQRQLAARSPRSAPGRRAPRAGSAISALSVISQVERSGRCRQAAAGRWMASGSSGSCSDLRREIDRHAEVVARRRSSGTAARSAAFSTQSVSGLIRPVCSASGMNSSGGISPSSGCCQRTSASTPTTVPVRASILGWYSSSSWSLLDRPAQLAGQASAGGRCWSSDSAS